MPSEKESELDIPLGQYVTDRFVLEREFSDLKYVSKSEQSDLSERIGNLETGLRRRVTYKQVLTVILPSIVGLVTIMSIVIGLVIKFMNLE